MTQRTRTLVGIGIGLVAAAWWAVLTVVQNAAEPIAYAENNTYWNRDARWLALLALAIALVWSFRGDRVVSWTAAGGYVASVGLDILVDRLDAVWLGAAIAAWAGGWLLGWRRRVRPNPRSSLLAATLAAAGAIYAAMLSSPSDREWSLAVSALLIAGLLAALALCCASDAGALSRAVAITAAAVGAPLLVAARLVPMPLGLLPAFGLAVTLVLSVGLLGRGDADPQTRVAVTCAALAVTAVVYVFALAGDIYLGSGRVFTELAGNPAINSADSDVSFALEAILMGLVLGSVVSARFWGSAASPTETEEPQAEAA